jgi:hypothetical protein
MADKPATMIRESPQSKEVDSVLDKQEQNKPSRIFNLRAEGSIATRARSVIEVSYKSDSGEILAWSE